MNFGLTIFYALAPWASLFGQQGVAPVLIFSDRAAVHKPQIFIDFYPQSEAGLPTQFFRVAINRISPNLKSLIIAEPYSFLDCKNNAVIRGFYFGLNSSTRGNKSRQSRMRVFRIPAVNFTTYNGKAFNPASGLPVVFESPAKFDAGDIISGHLVCQTVNFTQAHYRSCSRNLRVNGPSSSPRSFSRQPEGPQQRYSSDYAEPELILSPQGSFSGPLRGCPLSAKIGIVVILAGLAWPLVFRGFDLFDGLGLDRLRDRRRGLLCSLCGLGLIGLSALVWW
ncbi:MAG: hypothetical protein H7267_15205 [Sandarakinorhabdus sp.]|nr:hypothetical protein [Sandarakinorhabdus sp.]